MTRMEYIGGSIPLKPPPGEITLISAGLGSFLTVLLESCELVAETELVDSVRSSFGSVGIASFIGELEYEEGSNEETDERSDRMLLVRAADRTEGSELVDDSAGESRGRSGDAYGDGDEAYSLKNFGDGLAITSGGIVIDGVFVNRGIGVGVVTGPGEKGSIGMVPTPGVGGGAGGMSSLVGSTVLMKNMKVEPLPGMPFALMSPPCR